MKKYPYIGKSKHNGKIVLFSSMSTGVDLDDASQSYVVNWHESAFLNATSKHLNNTYGNVVSREHAEFIVELAENAGFKVVTEPADSDLRFLILSPGFVYFYRADISESFEGRKIREITIPLPPKSESDSNHSEKPNGCDVTTVDEWIEEMEIAADDWPQVGDKVTVFGQQGVVVLLADKHGVFIVEANRGYLAPQLRDLSKPKSKEDLLIEELQTKLCNLNAVDNYILASEIIMGNIDGLSYVGDKKSDTGGE